MIDKWTAEERFLRLESDVLNALTQDFEGAFLISRPARWLAAARKVLRLLEYAGRYRTHLGAEAADAELTPTERHVSVWRQLLAHPLRQRTVHTLVLSDRTLVVSRGFLSLSWRLSAVGEGRLRALVNRWHRTSACWWDRFSRHRTFPVLFPDAPDTARSIRLLDRIARRIARELRLDELLEGIPPWVDEVVFVPDGPLHVMPLVALPCGSEYLGQQYFVTNSFGVPGRGKERGLGRKGLVVDVSEPLRDPAAPDAPPLAPLPKAAEEAKAVEAVAAGYLGADVTWVSSGGSEGAMPPFKQRVVEGLGSCTFAHLSCHGTFNPDSPYESGLVLPGPGGCWDILGVSEITALDLSGIRHLSLSACYSADSFRFPGRWVVGLPEAFWRAGVESLLGFLWPVEDAVTHALMTSYYARIARQSARRAVRALRRACLDESLADCRGLPLRHPFFWASLTAYRGASSSPARYS